MKTQAKNIQGRVRPVERGEFVPDGQVHWSLAGYLTHLANGCLSLVKGMGLTFGYFSHPGRIVTQQYPENRETLAMFPRFRGRLALVTDADSGAPLCTACGMCEKACPNGTISILTRRDSGNRKVLGRYIYRFSQCTLCNLCVESCAFSAIRMAQDFELAAYDRGDLQLVLYGKEE